LNTYRDDGFRRRWLFWCAVAGLLAVCSSISASALDPTRNVSQYLRESWGTERGWPGGSITAIAQTSDGYLWIGTDKGLIRFDGLTFHQIQRANPDPIWIGPVRTLVVDASNNLWILLQNTSVFRYQNGNFELIRGETENGTTAIARGILGAVLLSSLAEGTRTYSDNQFRSLSSAALPTGAAKIAPDQRTTPFSWFDRLAAPTSVVVSMTQTDDGKIWLGTEHQGLFYLQEGRVSNASKSRDETKFNCLLPVQNSGLWVGTSKGLLRWDGTKLTSAGVRSSLLNLDVLSILRDRDSNIWVGTSRGLFRYNDSGISSLSTTGAVAALFEDREGNIWIGGAHGIERLRDSAFVTYSLPNLKSQSMGPVYVDPGGRAWIAPIEGGLRWLKDGKSGVVTSDGIANDVVYSIAGDGKEDIWVGRQQGGLTHLRYSGSSVSANTYTVKNGLAQNRVYAVYRSRDGAAWSGTLNRGLSKLENGRFTNYTTKDGLAANTISSIAESPDGTMWFGTPNGVSAMSQNGWRTYTGRDGLPSEDINCLFQDSTGILWIGTAKGLAYFSHGTMHSLVGVPDSLREEIFGIEEDKNGWLWVATPDHVLRVERNKLLSDAVKTVDVREYDQADGIESAQGVKRSRSVVSDSAGRIWISLSIGLAVVNPSQVDIHSVPALPHIEAITADNNNTVNLAVSVRIPPSPRRITFDYTGLSLAAPSRIRFRYFLEGFDRGWSKPVTTREAVYTNLGPGSYRFRLVASNSEGLWNGPETVVTLNVAPAYYQTVWFRTLGMFLFLAILAGFYRLRLRHLERQRDALRKSEQELRDVIDTISATVWSALPDGSNIYVNKHFAEYSGVSADQTVGSGWKSVVHPDDIERHAGKWMDAVATGKPHESELRFRRSDGQYRWHLDRGVPLRDEYGNIVKWYGVTTDIEDRKRAEAALQMVSSDLQESKAKLEEAQRITHVGYWEWDLITNGVIWSDETYRIYGLRPQEEPMNVTKVREKIHPDDWEVVSQALEEALSGGARYNAETRVFRPTGEVRIVHSQGEVKRDAAGRAYQMFGTVQDITDRKHAEEALAVMSRDVQESKTRLEEAQRIAHVGHWIWDLDNDGLTWSDETYRIFGMRPQERSMNVTAFQEMIHPEDREFLFHTTQEARAEGRPEIEFRIIRPTGEVRVVHSQGAVTRGVPGQRRQRFGAVQDITDHKRADEELRRSQFYLSEGQRLAQMGSWAFNPAGFFDYWSEELFRIYGLDPLKGAPTLEQYLATIHAQDRDFMANTIKRMHAERCGCDVKKRIVHPDGELRYIRCVGIPVVDGDVLKGFLGTAINITEQELLSQESERRQAHLTEAQRLTHTASWEWRLRDRRSVALSEEWYRIFGFDPANGAPTWEEYIERIHPEDRLECQDSIERAIAQKIDYEREFRILLPNGTMKWIHIVSHPILSTTGDLEGFVGSSIDITELKSAEHERERLRQLEADLAHIDRVSTLGEMAASLAHEIKQPIAAAITSANTCIEWLSHDPPNLERARAAAARIDKYGNRAAEIIDRIRSFYKKSPPQRELVEVNVIIEEMLTLLKGEAVRYSVSMRTDLSTHPPEIMVDPVQLQQVFMNLMLNGIEAMENSGGELTVKSKLEEGQLQFSISDTGMGLPMGGMDQIFSAFFTTKPQGSGMGLAISRSIVESHGGHLWATANDGRGATFHFTLPIQVTETSSLGS
jgi:PAS domain S-box-containing protein